MKEQLNTAQTYYVNPLDLEHLKIEVLNYNYTVMLIDIDGKEILKDYRNSIMEAIDDLHQDPI